MLRHARGRNTTDQINRVATMSGVYGRTIHDEICRTLAKPSGPLPRESRDVYEEDLKSWLSKVKDSNLFGYEAGRYHQGLEGFSQSTNITEKDKLATKLTKHSKDLDFWRRQKLRRVIQQ